MKFQIRVDDAIATLDKNLTDHILELNDATEVWVDKMNQALTKYSVAINSKGLLASHMELNQLMNFPPIDHRANYSKYITSFEKARDAGQTTIEVDEEDIAHIYQDNWDWRNYSKTTNSNYSK